MIRTFTSFIFLLILIVNDCNAQLSINKIGTYQQARENGVTKTIVIEMPYAKHDVIKISGDTAGLRNGGEIIIDIVCTDFPSSSSLAELNDQRIKTFYRLFDFVDPKRVNDTRLFRQMDGSKKENAQTMFHGLVIHYWPPQTPTTMSHDIVKLDEILSNFIPFADEKIKKDIPKSKVLPGSFHADSLKKITAPTSGKKTNYWAIIHANNKKDVPKDPVSNRRSGLIDSSIRYRTSRPKPSDEISPTIDSASITTSAHGKYKLPDSTVLIILNRNEWKNMSITEDVTGSMYAYTAELLIWLSLQAEDNGHFSYTCFNDGDNLTDDKKIIGKTGGIYSCECNSFNDVLHLIRATMAKGAGGDIPENDVEALMESEKRFPDLEYHVLIADNMAPIRDLKLKDQLKKPVRIVLCGVLNDIVNVDYLDLARASKGSVHLINEDIINLAALKEGEGIQIGNKTYIIANDHFKDYSTLNKK